MRKTTKNQTREQAARLAASLFRLVAELRALAATDAGERAACLRDAAKIERKALAFARRAGDALDRGAAPKGLVALLDAEGGR